MSSSIRALHGHLSSLSFNRSGVPHVVLPVWFDTYDYAQRAEFLNIGIFGSKTSAPGVHAAEFGRALVRVTGDSAEAEKFRMSAKRLKELCKAKGNGRELASAAILKEAAGIRHTATRYVHKLAQGGHTTKMATAVASVECKRHDYWNCSLGRVSGSQVIHLTLMLQVIGPLDIACRKLSN